MKVKGISRPNPLRCNGFGGLGGAWYAKSTQVFQFTVSLDLFAMWWYIRLAQSDKSGFCDYGGGNMNDTVLVGIGILLVLLRHDSFKFENSKVWYDEKNLKGVGT